MKIAYIGIDLFYPAPLLLLNMGCEIVEIFTCETDNITEFNVKIIDFAKKYNIPFTTKRISIDDIERLKNSGCDAAICAGYYHKIPVVSDFPMVNIHPSLLPVGRGSWPMPQTILKGMKKSGVTFHKISEDFDAGDILLQKEFYLSETETLVSFMEKVNHLLPEMLKVLIENFDELYKNASLQKGGEYWDAPVEKDYTITPDMSADEADLILRAFLGYECIYKSKSEKFVILGGKLIKEKPADKICLAVRGGYVQYDKIRKL